MRAKKKTTTKRRVSLGVSTTNNDSIVFETRLAEFLEQQCAATALTVTDIKDIVWNEQDTNLVSRFAFEIAEQNPKTNFEEILQMTNDAWNQFPHKNLNGLAPHDMVERMNTDDTFTPEARLDFYTLFVDRFPKMPQVVKMRDRDWSWEYPATFHTTRTKLSAMREKDWELKNKEIKRELLREVRIVTAKMALDQEPLMFDAAVILSQDAFEEGETQLAKSILESAIYEGRKIFPYEFSLGTDHLLWGFVDNRPFLRLLGEHATFIESVYGPQKAIPLYEELVALNPNDNQGIRELLATAYMKTNQLDSLLELDAKYPDDMMAGLKIGALLALYKTGRLDKAKNGIKKSMKRFQHVFREILKTDHPQPELIPGRVQVGGDDEAWLYWEHQGSFWMAARGAREFLRANTT
jgi:tetratricopeptide (TPR) repeat protein